MAGTLATFNCLLTNSLQVTDESLSKHYASSTDGPSSIYHHSEPGSQFPWSIAFSNEMTRLRCSEIGCALPRMRGEFNSQPEVTLATYFVGEAAPSGSLSSLSGGNFQPARSSKDTPY